MIYPSFIHTPRWAGNRKMPLMQVATARSQADVFGIVAEAAVAPPVVEEHESFRHDDAPFFHQAFDGQVQGSRETRGTLAASVGRGGGGSGEKKQDEEGVGEEEAGTAGTTEGEEVDHLMRWWEGWRRTLAGRPAAQE